jgi:hypothetical protein
MQVKRGSLEGLVEVAWKIAEEEDSKLRGIEALLRTGDRDAAIVEMERYFQTKKPNARAMVYGYKEKDAARN